MFKVKEGTVTIEYEFLDNESCFRVDDGCSIIITKIKNIRLEIINDNYYRLEIIEPYCKLIRQCTYESKIYNLKSTIETMKFYSLAFSKFKYYNMIPNDTRILFDCNDTIVSVDKVGYFSITMKSEYPTLSNTYYDIETFKDLFPQYFMEPIHKIVL